MPWPDTVLGLTRLRSKYILATLSNGNVSLLMNMAKNAGLPWDVILSSELTGHFKRDHEVYEKAADLLGLPHERIMMVAAHKGDLQAAGALGFKTGYVPRPLERGPDPGHRYYARSSVRRQRDGLSGSGCSASLGRHPACQAVRTSKKT